MTKTLQYELLMERFALAASLVGKDVIVELPHHPGYRRCVHVRRVIGYAAGIYFNSDANILAMNDKIKPAVGLVVSDFNTFGQPLPEEHFSQCLIMFDGDGTCLARVTPILYKE